MTNRDYANADLRDEVYALADACVHEAMTSEMARRLNELVCTNPAARQHYVEFMHDSFELHQLAAQELAAEPSAPSSPVLGFLGSAYHGVTGYLGDHDWAKGMLGGTVFLAMLFAVLGSIEIFSRWRQANRPQPQATQVVDVPAVRAARLTGVFDCRWTGTFRPPLHEVLDVNDYINLASGLAEVTYDSGAKVLLQGPCAYKIESPSSGYLQVGRMTARVKGNEELRTKKEELPAPTSSLLLPTSSFVVNTPTATVTDLGTEFGVDVDKQGTTDSLVFVGSVKVNTVVGDVQKQAGEVTLIENQSARVERQGGKQYVVRRDVVKSDNFVRPDQIQEWVAMAREAAAKRKLEAEEPKVPELDLTQFHRWQKFSKELCQRDDLLAYYDFQWDPDDKRDADNHELLRNKAKTAGGGLFGRNYDGQLWGAIEMGMIEGRFPGKHALKFQGHDDAIRVNVPVQCKQLTLAAWVTFDGLPSDDYAALLASDGYRGQPGGCHWHIEPEGKDDAMFVLGVSPGAPIKTPPLLPSTAWGESRWRHMAVAVDATTRRVTFYLDGRNVHEVAASYDLTTTLGWAQIGSWNPKEVGGYGVRFFRGKIDEFAIFTSALSDGEIERLYNDGKPESPQETVRPNEPPEEEAANDK